MSTRGCVAIGKEDGFCGVYNHYDSYPTGLGHEIWKELQKLKKNGTLDQFPQSLLAFDDWRNYLNGGRCPYCGKKGFGQACSISGKLFGDLDKEILNNIKRTGFPDPDSKYHSHGELTDKITSENCDPLFIEWVYVVEVEKHRMDILCSTRDGGWHEEDLGNGQTFRRPNYKHVLVTTIDLNGKEPNWKKIEQMGAKL